MPYSFSAPPLTGRFSKQRWPALRGAGSTDDRALPAGTVVEHAEWGAGTVLAAEEDRLTVLFDAVGYKELAANVVLGGHLLTQKPTGR